MERKAYYIIKYILWRHPEYSVMIWDLTIVVLFIVSSFCCCFCFSWTKHIKVRKMACDWLIFFMLTNMFFFLRLEVVFFLFLWQALGLKRDDTFSVTMLGHCIEMYIGDTDAYIGMIQLYSSFRVVISTFWKINVKKTFYILAELWKIQLCDALLVFVILFKSLWHFLIACYWVYLE